MIVERRRPSVLTDALVVDAPRHVGQPRDLIGDGAGDAEARRLDPPRVHALRPQELTDDVLEAVVFERDELAGLDHCRPIVGRADPAAGRVASKEPEQRLRSAHIAGEQHGCILV